MASDTIITLSTTGNAATGAGIAGSFDSNVGSDAQVIYSGPLSLVRGTPSGTEPQPFDYGFVACRCRSTSFRRWATCCST